MTIKTHNYITSAGETKTVMRLADICKAAGLANGELAVAFRGGRGSALAGEMLVMWAAPRVTKDANVSKGAATAGVSLTDMQAQMAALQQMVAALGAALPGGQVVQPTAPVATAGKRGRKVA